MLYYIILHYIVLSYNVLSSTRLYHAILKLYDTIETILGHIIFFYTILYYPRSSKPPELRNVLKSYRDSKYDLGKIP